VDAARNDLRAAAAWPLRVTDTTLAARLGSAIYRLRIAPLEPELAGVTELIVVSPDVDHGLPLEALCDTAGRWLGERFAISYTPSAYWSALRGERARSDARSGRAGWPALLVGDPAYASAPPSGVTAGVAEAAAAGDPATAASWPRLSGSGAEVRDIATLFSRARMLVGGDASEARLRALAEEGALASYRLVHLATHAAIDDRWPGRSALVLAEAGARRGAAADGYVTADDIAAGWRLDADLVSLASCRSALGPTTHVEGYLGLNHALLGAGARCLLVSLWRVEDQATAMLMREFYREWTRDPEPAPAVALQRAQRRLREWRDPSGRRPYQHPVYWAGVVLLGDAR
jgi:CHAT domain-containing protein